MKFDPEWFSTAKRVLIEATALASMALVAIAIIIHEYNHLFR
jgi:hypothetical protein